MVGRVAEVEIELIESEVEAEYRVEFEAEKVALQEADLVRVGRNEV